MAEKTLQLGAYTPLRARLAGLTAPQLVTLDGCCGSGKTSLAAELTAEFGGRVLHMDDFFLPFAQRTPERLAMAGGHMDFERLLAEVLRPLSQGETGLLRRYDCHTALFSAVQALPCGALTILEGSYAHHPSLAAVPALRVFLTCSREAQRARILAREGAAKLADFEARWMPAERAYYAAYDLPQECSMVIDTTVFF